MTKKKIITYIIIITAIFGPFVLNNMSDNIEAIYLNDSTVGYYQSTTCEISLFEFYIKNYNLSNSIYINNNDYADINCFGKITGLDKVNDKYYVSIGTNTSLSLFIQSIIWILFLSLIPKSGNKNYLSYKTLFVLPLLITFQQISEMRFYSKTNILYNSELSLENIYLFGIFVLNVFITFLIIDLLKGRMENLLNYIPYLFLFIGTYLGTNLNFYLLLLSCIGISYYFKKKSLLSSDKYFIFFLIFWVINIADNNYFFDGDKLRGFVNSNLTLRSQLFWIFLVFFTVRGLLYAINKNKESFNILKFINNFLVSGSMIVILGILGSISPLFNFFNFYIFGQNKRGMKELSSIAGNTWRGFSASAESIGEVFAFLLLILFMLAVNKKVKISNPFNLLLIFIFYGLIRSNNFAAMSSMIILIIFYLYLKHYKGRKVFIYLSIVSFIIASTLIGFSANFDYKFSSSNLIYESTRHQNFYENLPLASNQSGSTSKSHYLVLEAIDKNDVGTILLNDENLNNASSSYKFLLNVFTPNLNLKFIPNIVGLISIVSLYINRSEMWGIFIAKYDPNIFDFLFGYGPQQLNSYLFEQEVRLDVPSYKASSLFLPHSSLLDVLMFFGFLGTFAILIYTFKIFYNSHPNNYFFFPTIFLVINFIKSDSILYINSFVLIIFCVQMLKSKVNENE